MVRHAQDNPFSPGSDHVPRVWAGRIEQLSDFADRLAPRRLAGQGERGRTLLGEPGIGKSSLARRISADAREQGHLTSRQLRIPRGVDPIPLLAEELLRLADDVGLAARREAKLTELMRRVEALTVGPLGVHLATGEGMPAHRLLTLLLEEVARSGRNDGRLVVLQLDEVQNVEDGDQLSQLLIAIGDALTLVMLSAGPVNPTLPWERATQDPHLCRKSPNRDVVDGISTASVRCTYSGGRQDLTKRMDHAAQILNRS